MSKVISFVHALFIVFSIFGGLLLFDYPWLVLIHAPCVLWAISVEVFNITCPLTDLERHYRQDQAPMEVDFMTHYCFQYCLPDGLTVRHHRILGVVLFLAQGLVYTFALGSM